MKEKKPAKKRTLWGLYVALSGVSFAQIFYPYLLNYIVVAPYYIAIANGYLAYKIFTHPKCSRAERIAACLLFFAGQWYVLLIMSMAIGFSG